MKTELSKKEFDRLAYQAVDGKPESFYLVIHPIGNVEDPLLEEKIKKGNYKKKIEEDFIFYTLQESSKNALAKEYKQYGVTYLKKGFKPFHYLVFMKKKLK